MPSHITLPLFNNNGGFGTISLAILSRISAQQSSCAPMFLSTASDDASQAFFIGSSELRTCVKITSGELSKKLFEENRKEKTSDN